MPSRNLDMLAQLVSLNLQKQRTPRVQRNIKDSLSPKKSGPSFGKSGKFIILKELGLVEVPESFVHKSCIANFLKRNWNPNAINDINSAFSDTNYPNPTKEMRPNEKYNVWIIGQKVQETTSSERLMALDEENGLLLGAQGIVLVHEQKRQQLPKGYWYASLDNETNLWIADTQDKHGVPCLISYADGGYAIDIGDFENPFPPNVAFLCFKELKTS